MNTLYAEAGGIFLGKRHVVSSAYSYGWPKDTLRTLITQLDIHRQTDVNTERNKRCECLFTTLNRHMFVQVTFRSPGTNCQDFNTKKHLI
jgi:hypothetical protein